MMKDAALIVVDVQKGFDDPYWGRRNNPQAESNIERLLTEWRGKNRPIFHVQHLSTEADSPLRPDRPGCELKALAVPKTGEALIQKRVNSAFIGTDLEIQLRGAGIDTVVIVGLTTNHCVSTTTRMAGNLGFKAFVVADATACFDRLGHDGSRFKAEELHAASLANLHKEFATVIETDAVLAHAG